MISAVRRKIKRRVGRIEFDKKHNESSYLEPAPSFRAVFRFGQE